VDKTVRAFAPGAISSFFEIYDSSIGLKNADLINLGAVGGGFGLEKGVHTKVLVREASENTINIKINNQESEAKTSRQVIKNLLNKANRKYNVTVEHKIEVPIGMGFGTSAGGALTAGIALANAINLPLTYNQIGQVAHVAEIECQTGLGTVSSLNSSGGLVLVVEPGAPGICKIDRIPIPSDYMIVIGFYKSYISKSSVFSSPQKTEKIKQYGKQALASILNEPSLENFLASCWSFSEKAGFATENLRRLVKAAENAGAIGSAQNMIGEAIHAVVHEKNVDSVAEAFKQTLPSQQVIVSKIDFQGARLRK